MKRLYWIILPTLAAMLIAMAACGGDDNSSTKPTATRGGQEPAANTANTPDAQEAPTKAQGGGQVTGTGANSLKQLATDLSKKTYSVSYAMTGTQDGKPGATAMTIGQKPPKSLTSFTTTAANGKQSLVILIDDGTNNFTCIKEDPGDGQCIKMKSAGGSGLGASVFSLSDSLKNLSDNVNVTEAGSRTIAGIDSQCFTAKETTSEGMACFSKKDGLLTLLDSKGNDGSANHLEATKAASSVDDAVFAPPSGYTVVDNSGR